MTQLGQTLTEGPASYTYKEDGSGTTTRTFTGTEDEIRNITSQLHTAGYATQTEQGPPWKVIGTLSYNIMVDGSEAEPEAIWNIQGSEGERSILECSDLEFIQNIHSDTKEKMLIALKNPGKNLPLYLPTVSSDEKIAADQIYIYMKVGADSRRFNTVTVSRSITVSRRYVSTWDLTNVNKVLSKNSLVSSTNMPNWVQVLIPNSEVRVKVADNIFVNRGYLQGYPNYQSVANNQVQISQAWVFNDWIEFYYQFV
jgi:hypothetical protein